MSTVAYKWSADGEEHSFELVQVRGTDGQPFLFGREPNRRPINIREFYISTTPVTQALWLHVMGSNPAKWPGIRCPVENVSWKHITEPGGFLDRINSSEMLTAVNEGDPQMRFRLPSETEWEYAARGGPHWKDGFVYSGSNDITEVAWYGPHWGRRHELVLRMFGWPLGWRLANRIHLPRRDTRTHEVALKAPNQLGIYDMSGNVFEWCQDVCTDDLTLTPADGSPYLGPGDERRLRGGCHQNWNLFCTVSWRYGIEPDAHDHCLGFRVVLV
jgi:formylglycine-generating enzyme required for sulfatase activity